MYFQDRSLALWGGSVLGLASTFRKFRFAGNDGLQTNSSSYSCLSMLEVAWAQYQKKRPAQGPFQGLTMHSRFLLASRWSIRLLETFIRRRNFHRAASYTFIFEKHGQKNKEKEEQGNKLTLATLKRYAVAVAVARGYAVMTAIATVSHEKQKKKPAPFVGRKGRERE